MKRNRFATYAAIVALGFSLAACKASAPVSIKQVVMDAKDNYIPEVVAVIDGEDVSREVISALPDAKARLHRQEMALYEAEKRNYEAFAAEVNTYIEAELLEREANKTKMSAEALIKKEVTDKIGTVSDKEAKAFYDEKKLKQEYSSIKEKIVEYLSKQKEGELRTAYIDKLKKKYNVTTTMGPFPKSEPIPPKIDVAILDHNASRGPKDAKITIVEFSDFECPFCKKANDTVYQVLDKYKDDIRLVFRHYPLPFHKNGKPAAVAAECAKDQQKFWEFHDLLFENQRSLNEETYIAHATQLKLDIDKFKTCLASDYGKRVDVDTADARAAGVTGTPAFFINGRLLSGAQPFEKFQSVIDAELKTKG